MEDTLLASLSFTHVHYNPSDPISYLCAWLALVPQGLCVSYVTLIIATREAELMLMFAGQMGCEVVNFGLKRLIKEERPPKMNGKGYGMPSSHSQFLAFYAVSLSLFLLLRHGSSSSSSSSTHPSTSSSLPSSPPTSTPPSPTPIPLPLRLVASLASVLLATLVCCSRVYLNYHTPRQVLVGAASGVATALAWYGATREARRWGLVGWALELQGSRLLKVRDLLVEEDFGEAGWREWEWRRGRRRRRRREGKGRGGGMVEKGGKGD